MLDYELIKFSMFYDLVNGWINHFRVQYILVHSLLKGSWENQKWFIMALLQNPFWNLFLRVYVHHFGLMLGNKGNPWLQNILTLKWVFVDQQLYWIMNNKASLYIYKELRSKVFIPQMQRSRAAPV